MEANKHIIVLVDDSCIDICCNDSAVRQNEAIVQPIRNMRLQLFDMCLFPEIPTSREHSH